MLAVFIVATVIFVAATFLTRPAPHDDRPTWHKRPPR